MQVRVGHQQPNRIGWLGFPSWLSRGIIFQLHRSMLITSITGMCGPDLLLTDGRHIARMLLSAVLSNKQLIYNCMIIFLRFSMQLCIRNAIYN